MKKYLFLPDNLTTILYEEQKLIQSLLSFPFRNYFPYFQTEKKFDFIIIYPPIIYDGFIIRPCNDVLLAEGFVLGRAGEYADYIIDNLDNLKKKTDIPVFSILKCKSWYYADAEFTQSENNGTGNWIIKNKTWQKQITD